ncbi:hypothetical protein BN874_1740020 [Candidatus Contendobacter odensis Run_B_J11]|uniref:Uncharacterized protein n=1 Tax=Candidatus Contendobacter odensis Run_B_J11 TaxID=1400861 RepID=A0A7U7G9U3_9GAMM|nr:hypothetical protein BN874_1740020 [Candidatus Contendobacter odensis Run_B_J11]
MRYIAGFCEFVIRYEFETEFYLMIIRFILINFYDGTGVAYYIYCQPRLFLTQPLWNLAKYRRSQYIVCDAN